MPNLRLYSLILAAAAFPAAAAVSIDNLPGALAVNLADAGVDASRLDVTGEIDIRDLITLASLQVDTVCLRDAAVREFAASRPLLHDRYSFPADEIPDFVFAEAPAKVWILPAGVTGIGDAAFVGAKAEAVVLPEKLVSIGDFAFRDCRRLVSVTFPESLTHIGREAFAGDSALQEIDLGKTLIEEIPARAFAGCASLASVTLPESVSAIGELAFIGCPVRTLSLPRPLSAEAFAFAGMPALYEADVRVLAPGEADALFFLDGELSSVANPMSPIPPLAYAGASKIQVSAVARGAGNIGDYAFLENIYEYITLPAGISSVGKGIFSGSGDIKVIDCRDLEDNIPLADDDSFAGIDCENIKLYVTSKSFPLWKAAPGWSRFNVVDDINGVDEVIDAGFFVRARDGELFVHASEPLRSVTVVASDGRILANANPDNTDARIHFSTPADRIIIVVSSTDSFSHRDKIIL